MQCRGFRQLQSLSKHCSTLGLGVGTPQLEALIYLHHLTQTYYCLNAILYTCTIFSTFSFQLNVNHVHMSRMCHTNIKSEKWTCLKNFQHTQLKHFHLILFLNILCAYRNARYGWADTLVTQSVSAWLLHSLLYCSSFVAQCPVDLDAPWVNLNTWCKCCWWSKNHHQQSPPGDFMRFLML